MMLGVWVDAASFERVYDSLQEFHAFFAASFGRKQWRDHSGNYLQALLVQDQERRNAENLSESVGISARAMQRFLTEARWSDETVIGRLQEYLAPRLGHPEAVWVFDGSDFPKQGRKSAGVARQYCGRLGKVANCQSRFRRLGPTSSPGLRLYPEWASDQPVAARPLASLGRRWWICPPRTAAAGPAELPADGVGPGDAGAGPGVGLPQGRVGCRRRRLRDVADLPGGTGGPGDALRAGRSGRHYGLALGPGLDQSGISGVRPPPQTQAAAWAAADHGAAR